MDSFCEQIIKIKKTPSKIAALVFVWVFTVLIVGVCLMLLKHTPLVIFVGAAAIYGAYKLTGAINIEFEYTFTNGEVDIDKIINQSSRKEVVSFDCKSIEQIKKLEGNYKKSSENKLFVCTDDFENAYLFKIAMQNGNKCSVVFSPDEKLIKNMKIFIPRSVYSGIWN